MQCYVKEVVRSYYYLDLNVHIPPQNKDIIKTVIIPINNVMSGRSSVHITILTTLGPITAYTPYFED